MTSVKGTTLRMAPNNTVLTIGNDLYIKSVEWTDDTQTDLVVVVRYLGFKTSGGSLYILPERGGPVNIDLDTTCYIMVF